MMRSILICCLFLPLFTFAQEIEWASRVISFSTQTSEKIYSANQALGKPNKFPQPGRTTCAWMPKPSGSLNEEYIIVSFSKPLAAKQILVAENYNPGHIRAVYTFDSIQNMKQVYARPGGTEPGGTGRLFSIELKNQKERIFMVKLVLDEAEVYNTYQIDAIGITTFPDPVTLQIAQVEDGDKYKAEQLGSSINSEFDEIYPIISPDGKTLYFDRKLHPFNTGVNKFDDIWFSTLSAEGWSMPANIGKPFNDDGFNFLCSVSPDGNSALIGGNYGEIGPGVAFSGRTDEGWQTPRPIRINKFININAYNEFNLAADGTTLIMSIENSESLGLRDLYVSFLQANGIFSTPINIGKQVNTAGDEMSPFLAADGKTLYFSSNGHPGYGGPDIFVTKRLDESWTNWSEPLNMGTSVNSPEFDVYYSIDAIGEYAYFSSSYTSKTNLDIFRIKLPPEAQPENVVWLKGIVRDRSSGLNIPARVEVYNLTDSLLIGYSNSTTASSYAVLIPGDNVRRVKITAEGYYSMDTTIAVFKVPVFTEVEQDFSLIPKRTGVIIEMKNIQFKVNSSILEDTSFLELDKVVKFLVENPGVTIEVRGHTNGLCDDSYCNSLSLRRAKSVQEYFINKGIALERVTAMGYGKTIPIADNKTPEGRQRNQRVEFMITKAD